MVLVLLNKNTNKWDTISEEDKDKLSEENKIRVLYLDGKLKRKLDFAKHQIGLNNDCVGAITGNEGSGKSSVAGNIMRYMTDDKFNPNMHMIGSDYEDALNKLESVPFGGALMFDEGNAFFLSTETMTRETRDLHKLFSIFRQKNLFVLIILPSFFRLSSYFAVDRTRFLIRTYMKNGKRGCFAYYGDKTKGKLYRLGKKELDDRKVAPTFRGRFTSCISLETQEYKNFKLKTLREAFSRAKTAKQSPADIRREVIMKIATANPEISSRKLSEMTGIPDRYIRTMRQKSEQSPEKRTKTEDIEGCV
jgi:hypothetical protein